MFKARPIIPVSPELRASAQDLQLSPGHIVKTLKARFEHRQPEIWFEAFKTARKLLWLLMGSLILNGLLVLLCAALIGRPADVVLVDKLGQAAYFPSASSPEPPQNYEIEAFAQDWVRRFLSLDAVTAADDLASALSQTEKNLHQRLKSILVDSGAIDKIRNAYVHSVLKIAEVKTTSQSKDRYLIQVTGTRTLIPLGMPEKKIDEPIHLELILQPVPRTANTPNGLIVRYLNGNSHEKITQSNLPEGSK